MRIILFSVTALFFVRLKSSLKEREAGTMKTKLISSLKIIGVELFRQYFDCGRYLQLCSGFRISDDRFFRNSPDFQPAVCTARRPHNHCPECSGSDAVLQTPGKQFFLRSVRCMVISSIMIDYLAPLFPVYTGSRMLAAICTGVLAGPGLCHYLYAEFLYRRHRLYHNGSKSLKALLIPR